MTALLKATYEAEVDLDSKYQQLIESYVPKKGNSKQDQGHIRSNSVLPVVHTKRDSIM